MASSMVRAVLADVVASSAFKCLYIFVRICNFSATKIYRLKIPKKKSLGVRPNKSNSLVGSVEAF